MTETFGNGLDNGHPFFAIAEFGMTRFDSGNSNTEVETDKSEFGVNERVAIMPDRDIVIYGSYHITGIEDVKVENGKAKAIYDLQGREVTNPTYGIYIIDGKKVLVK